MTQSESDVDGGRTEQKMPNQQLYAYDPHIDPSLQFDPQRSQIERIIDDGTATETIEERSLFPKQVFFLMAETKDSWSRLAKNLLAEIDVELIKTYRGIESLKIAEAENDPSTDRPTEKRDRQILQEMEDP